jgi:hypothetical protein
MNEVYANEADFQHSNILGRFEIINTAGTNKATMRLVRLTNVAVAIGKY